MSASIWAPDANTALVQAVVDSLTGTSATAATISAGSKSFTTQGAKLFIVGNWVLVVETSNINNYMLGQITAYNTSTGALVITVPANAFNGSGSHSDWNITVSGIQGISGSLSGSVAGNIEFLGNIDIDGTLNVDGAVTMHSTLLLAASPSLTLQAATKGYADELMPIGTILDYSSDVVPNFRWALANGQAISRVTYATLFGLVSTFYGVGDGVTTFNIPDLRRRTTIGLGGAGTGTIGATIGSVGGEENHTLITSEIPVHHHMNKYSHTATAVTPAGDVRMTLGNAAGGLTVDNGSDAGSGAAHNNIQPSFVANKIIRVL